MCRVHFGLTKRQKMSLPALMLQFMSLVIWFSVKFNMFPDKLKLSILIFLFTHIFTYMTVCCNIHCLHISCCSSLSHQSCKTLSFCQRSCELSFQALAWNHQPAHWLVCWLTKTLFQQLQNSVPTFQPAPPQSRQGYCFSIQVKNAEANARQGNTWTCARQ